MAVDGSLELSQPGTLQGSYESREASRQAGWLALNVGGVVGGVFITVAALGGIKWAYAVGGGVLLGGGAIFALTYRADRATVSFSPDEPADVKGLPPAARAANSRVTPTSIANLDALDRPAFAARAPGLGMRIEF